MYMHIEEIFLMKYEKLFEKDCLKLTSFEVSGQAFKSHALGMSY